MINVEAVVIVREVRMRLDSARELKLQLVSGLLPRAAAPMRVRAMGVPATGLAHLYDPHPTVALGVSLKRGKRRDFKLAVRVQRRAIEDSGLIAVIKNRARGEVDVRYVGRVTKSVPWHQTRRRPLLIGSSIGHHQVTAGTLACVVAKKDGTLRLLSNNHVFADENRSRAGSAIYQPGAADGGKARDKVATLAEFIPLHVRRPNTVDAALARPMRSIDLRADALRGVGTLTGSIGADWEETELVEKIGRTTGHTKGRVTAIEVDNLIVEYDTGSMTFNNQIEIEGRGRDAFSRGGDSGSLVFTSNDLEAFALLFAGGTTGGRNGRGLTYASPIGTVFKRLGVSLVL